MDQFANKDMTGDSKYAFSTFDILLHKICMFQRKCGSRFMHPNYDCSIPYQINMMK